MFLETEFRVYCELCVFPCWESPRRTEVKDEVCVPAHARHLVPRIAQFVALVIAGGNHREDLVKANHDGTFFKARSRVPHLLLSLWTSCVPQQSCLRLHWAMWEIPSPSAGIRRKRYNVKQQEYREDSDRLIHTAVQWGIFWEVCIQHEVIVIQITWLQVVQEVLKDT